MLRVLLENGADPRAENEEGTPLFLEARFNREEDAQVPILKLLIEHGADVDATDVFEETLLLHSVIVSDDEISALLLEAGATVDFISACGLGRVEEVRAALEDDRSLANLSMSCWAKSPAALAAGRGRLGVLRLLVAAGASVEGSTQFSPLPLAVRQGHAEMVEFLLECGLDVEMRCGPSDSTLLACAVGSGDVALVSRFLKLGLKVESQDAVGSTPLHRAAGRGNSGMIEVLLAAGADIEASDSRGETPLHCAVRRSADPSEAIELLLARGANVEARSASGETPLQAAEGRLAKLRGSTEPGDASKAERIEKAVAILREHAGGK